MRTVIGRVCALTLALALGACGGEDSFSPTVDTVSGPYTATTFTVRTAATSTSTWSGHGP
jgi:hypothetical protein